MQTYYLFSGIWGVNILNTQILKAGVYYLLLAHDGTPQAECFALRRAMRELEDKHWEDIKNDVLRAGFTRESCFWVSQTLCPALSQAQQFELRNQSKINPEQIHGNY